MEKITEKVYEEITGSKIKYLLLNDPLGQSWQIRIKSLPQDREFQKKTGKWYFSRDEGDWITINKKSSCYHSVEVWLELEGSSYYSELIIAKENGEVIDSFCFDSKRELSDADRNSLSRSKDTVDMRWYFYFKFP